MKKREKKYIEKKKTKPIWFNSGTLYIQSDNYRVISFLDNHPFNKR